MQHRHAGSWRAALRVVGVVATLLLVVGCAVGLVNHAFSFDTRDEPGVEILDYRYGDSRQPGARANASAVARGASIAQNVNIVGEIRRPESLYVRWRDLISGKSYEDTVDLARLLPRDITDHRIHFTAQGPWLFVYLITPQRRAPNDPPAGPAEYRYRKVITLATDYGREMTAK